MPGGKSAPPRTWDLYSFSRIYFAGDMIMMKANGFLQDHFPPEYS